MARDPKTDRVIVGKSKPRHAGLHSGQNMTKAGYASNSAVFKDLRKARGRDEKDNG
jgi:hypothetical protein